MRLEGDPVVSAQVLLHSASGTKITGETMITSENISEYAPSADTVAQAFAVLAELGFQVGEMVGISLSITAPASTFEKVFGLRLSQGEDGGIKVVANDGATGDEVPATNWPERLADLAMAVTFVPPPELFGPRNHFGP